MVEVTWGYSAPMAAESFATLSSNGRVEGVLHQPIDTAVLAHQRRGGCAGSGGDGGDGRAEVCRAYRQRGVARCIRRFPDIHIVALACQQRPSLGSTKYRWIDAAGGSGRRAGDRRAAANEAASAEQSAVFAIDRAWHGQIGGQGTDSKVFTR